MNRKTINVIIGIAIAFFLLFFAGYIGYEQYLIYKSDQQLEDTEKETDELYKENQSGQTNEESKNN